MKYMKMLGLAAIAAAALMAFVGASSASATVLCKVTPEGANATCPSTQDYPAGTKIESTLEAGTTAILESGSTVLDTCTASTVAGETKTTGSATETVKGPITTLSWGTAATPCSKTTDTISKGELEIHWIKGTHNGTLVGKGSEVTINTIFGTCVYGSSTGITFGTVESGSPAKIAINAVVPKISGNFACPETSRWTANYTVTSPTPLYVGQEV